MRRKPSSADFGTVADAHPMTPGLVSSQEGNMKAFT
jgi:hypothetical protein